MFPKAEGINKNYVCRALVYFTSKGEGATAERIREYIARRFYNMNTQEQYEDWVPLKLVIKSLEHMLQQAEVLRFHRSDHAEPLYYIRIE